MVVLCSVFSCCCVVSVLFVTAGCFPLLFSSVFCVVRACVYVVVLFPLCSSSFVVLLLVSVCCVCVTCCAFCCCVDGWCLVCWCCFCVVVVV